MSTASTARRRSRSRAWLRVLVLLLALLVPFAHTQAHALPLAAGVFVEAAEHDALDTVLRPTDRPDRRSAVRPRPGTPAKPAPGTPANPARSAPPQPSYLPHLLRTVVLRC